jgi:hypothetical protein
MMLRGEDEEEDEDENEKQDVEDEESGSLPAMLQHAPMHCQEAS